MLGGGHPWAPLQGAPCGPRPRSHRVRQSGVRAQPCDEGDPPLPRLGLQAGLDARVHRRRPIKPGQDRGRRLAIRLAQQLHGQGRLRPAALARRQLTVTAVQAGRMRQIRPGLARPQVPPHHPVVRPHGLRPMGTAGTRLVNGARPPALLAGPMPRGIIDGDRGLWAPSGWPFLFEHAAGLAFDRLAIPGAIRGKALQHAPARFQTEGGQDLREGMLFPAPHRPGAPWHETHPAWPSETRHKGAQQRQPPQPQWWRLIQDAPPLLAPLLGRSPPNRMPWGASWWVKILETTV